MVKQYEALGQYVIALQNTYENIDEMFKFAPEANVWNNELMIRSVMGVHVVSDGDFVIKDNSGNFHVMPEPTFNKFFGLWRTLPTLTNSQEEEYYREIIEELSRVKVNLMRVNGEMIKRIIFRKKTYDFPPDYDNKRLVTDTADKVFNSWKGLTL